MLLDKLQRKYEWSEMLTMHVFGRQNIHLRIRFINIIISISSQFF